MMPHAQRFTYGRLDPRRNNTESLPLLPITFELRGKSVSVSALIDSGSTVSVLPFRLGVELGAVWDEQPVAVQLAGNLAKSESRGLILNATIAPFAAIPLVFAWTQNEQVPVILGQVNFFSEFDVCLFGSKFAFEIRPK